MADTTLTNVASASGTYNDISTAMESTVVTTLLVDGLSITKEADQQVWVTGELTYTVTVTNDAEYPYENAAVTDTLDPSLIKLVDGSVTVDGAPTSDYTYDPATGLLTVNVGTIATGGNAVVTFQVEKA